ncbi:unnamed protein product [Durusdinium trenchii]|uniref:Major facilitator superfamily (MFS) profile domain-containing protein n=1 Tax=Durusdinium trenchii TaxID=1381693 RepID=A0ABP0I3Y5_9DINO
MEMISAVSDAMCEAEDCESELHPVVLLQSSLTLKSRNEDAAQMSMVAVASAPMASAASEILQKLSDGLVSSPPLRRSAPLLILTAFMILLLLCYGLRQCVRSSSFFQGRTDPAQRRSQMGIYGILFTQTLNALATMVVLPTLPFFAMKLGASALEVSLMNSAYNLAQMFCSPLMGALSDRFGRKRVMLLGIFTQMICNLFMTRAHTLMSLMITRMAVGVALSTGPVEMAYIMDFLNTEEELSRVLALQRVMTSAGALAGPLVARSFDRLPFNSLCGGVVVINVINLIIGLLLWEDVKEKTKTLADMDTAAAGLSETNGNSETEKSFPQSVYMMFSNHSACALLAVSFVYALGFAIGDGPEMVFFKERYGFGKDQACIFYLLTNVSTLVCSAPRRRPLTTFEPLTLCIAGSLSGALCTLLLVLGPVASWVPYAFGVSMVGLSGTMIGMGFMHLVRDHCPEDLMGTMLGIQSSLNGAAGALAPPLGGFLYRLNMFFPFLCTSAACALTGLLYETTLQKEELPEEPKVKKEPTAPVVHRKSAKLRRTWQTHLRSVGHSHIASWSFLTTTRCSECLRGLALVSFLPSLSHHKCFFLEIIMIRPPDVLAPRISQSCSSCGSFLRLHQKVGPD